ncbi:MAG: ABC transporter ATP-binding protein [Candidatus Kapaibacterium sp.]
MALIKTDAVKKTYSEGGVPVRAIKGVDMEVEKGEYMAIAGASGSGKTTLLNMIGTLDSPTEGRIFMNDEDLYQKEKSELSELRLRKFGFIFQAYNLIPVLTAIENVEFPLILQGVEEKERQAKAQDVLDSLGIGELANKRPNEMSGGQQQRVAVGRAIVTEPLIVLADEPTANLDSKSSKSLLELMRKMNEEKNITFIFSSHDKEIMEQCRRVVYLKDGLIDHEESR